MDTQQIQMLQELRDEIQRSNTELNKEIEVCQARMRSRTEPLNVLDERMRIYTAQYCKNQMRLNKIDRILEGSK